MIKVKNEVYASELNGRRADSRSLTIESHWNNPDLVVISFQDDHKLTFSARDLQAAIKNATNMNRY